MTWQHTPRGLVVGLVLGFPLAWVPAEAQDEPLAARWCLDEGDGLEVDDAAGENGGDLVNMDESP